MLDVEFILREQERFLAAVKMDVRVLPLLPASRWAPALGLGRARVQVFPDEADEVRPAEAGEQTGKHVGSAF